MYLWSDLLAVFVFAWVAAMIPGQDTAMILRNCLVFSRRDGWYTSLGIAAGLCVHAALALAGVGVLIAQSLLVFTIVKWAGAAFLVYIGVRCLLARRRTQAPAEEGAPPPGTRHGLGAWPAFRLGLLSNVLNPKAPLLFLAAFTQIAHPGTPPAALGLYGLTIAVAGLLWYTLLTSVLSHGRVRGLLLAAGHWIERVAGAVFIALGVRLALARVA